MGERLREGQAGEGPAEEAGERQLLSGDEESLPQSAWAPVARSDVGGGFAFPIPDPKSPSRPFGLAHIVGKRISAGSLRAAIDMELDRGAAFLLVPVFLALGAFAYFGLTNEPALTPLAILTGSLVVLAHVARPYRWVHYGFAAAALCLVGMTAAKLEAARLDTKMLGAEVSTRLEGRVVEMDRTGEGRLRLTIDVLSTERPKLRYAPDRVRLTARRAVDGIAVGSLVGGYVRLMPPSGPVRPGSYDFSFESYFDGIGASGFFMSGPDVLATSSPVPLAAAAAAWVENLRNRAAMRIRDRIGGVEGEIAAALVVGVRGGIPEEVNESLRRTGLYHIISISGLHMAMVAGTVMLVLRLGFSAFPGFSSRRPVKKYAALLALFSTGAYLFVSGAEVAAQRSFIMLAVMLTAVLFDRAALTMRNLAISAIIVILLSPHEVVGPSFQMSFAATAALVGAYAWWSDHRADRQQASVQRSLPGMALRRLSAIGMGLIATSLIAGMATAVFGAWHFQRISPLSLFANLAAMPIVSVLVMPFAVAAGALMPLGLDGPFLDTMGLGLGAMIGLAEWFSVRSPIDAIGLVPSEAVALVTTALCIAAMATTWLRVAALPFAVAGLLLLGQERTPDILISEDGRLVGVPTAAGKLAVNRARPSDFVTETWLRVIVAEEMVGPVGNARRGAAPAVNDAGAYPRNKATTSPQGQKAPGPEAFVCDDGLCLIVHSSGALIAHAATAEASKRACGAAKLIVVDDAAASQPCSQATVVTKRDLARFGSVAAFLPRDKSGPIEIQRAIAEPYRPWHAQRAFSREARGLPPFQRDRAKTTPEKVASPEKRTPLTAPGRDQ